MFKTGPGPRQPRPGHIRFERALAERGNEMSMKRVSWLIPLAAVLMLAAASGGSAQKLGAGASTNKLVIDNVSGSTWTCQFNPFNPALLGPGITFSLVYEPLEFVNILQSGNPPVPLLATSSGS